MEERDRVDASTNFGVDLWLSLVGGISAIARLTVLFYFLLLDLWLSLVEGISAIAWLTVLLLFSFNQPVAGTLAARLASLIFLNC